MTVHTLHIDSRDRDPQAASSPSKYTVRLPQKFKKVISARLVSAEIPSSFYVFRASYGNTSLNTIVNGVAKTITIPDGNYSGSTMAVALRNALNEAYQPWTFNVTLSKTTLKLTIINLDGYDVGVDTTTDAAGSREWGLGFFLGFEKNAILTGPVVTAPRVCATNPYTYLVLDIEELNGAFEGGLDGSAMATRGCFAKIPFSANSFEYVFLDASSASATPLSYKPPITSLDRLRVKWRFHDGRAVDFEHLEHSFTLELTTKDPEPLKQTDPVVSHVAEAASQAAQAAYRVATVVSRPLPTAPPPGLKQSNPQNTSYVKMGACVVLSALVVWYVTRKKPGPAMLGPA